MNSDWIPVSEKMPEVDARTRKSAQVLVFCTDRRQRIDAWEVLPGHPNGGAWRTLRNSAQAQVTHWRELPAAPAA